VPYNYQVQAFDFANDNSPLTPPLSLQTFITSVKPPRRIWRPRPWSPQEIDLSWSPPSNTTGLGSYLIYSGTSRSDLQQIATRPSGTTTFNDLNLAAATTYYFGIIAVEQGIEAPMSTTAYGHHAAAADPAQQRNCDAYSPTKVALTWQENVQPNGLPISYYEIYQGTTAGNLTKIASATGTTYTATPLIPDTTYYFEIVAADTGRDPRFSIPSDQIAVTTDCCPNAPVNVACHGKRPPQK
jgi:hypothetical protein